MAFKFVINKELPRHVLHDKQMLKAAVIFFQLKSLYRVKVIKRFRKRWRELSEKIGVSESKLRTYIGIIKQYGWAIESKDGSLYLISRNKHCKMLGIEKCNKYVKISFVSNKKLEAIIYKYALCEHKNRQKYVIRKKVIDKKVAALQINDEGIRKKIRRKILKDTNVEKEVDKLREFGYYNTNQPFRFDSVGTFMSKGSINPFISMSRKKIGQVCGMRSESSGKRIANKLKRYKLMEDEPRKVKVQSNVTIGYFRKLGLPGSFFFWKGDIWKIEANLVRFLPDTKDNSNYVTNT